jgi:excisionase family DNA binding protein
MAIPHERETPATHRTDDESGYALLTVQDAARLLNVPVSWVYEHVRPGAQDRLPVLKVGKYLRFDARDLREYLAAKREASHYSRRRR